MESSHRIRLLLRASGNLNGEASSTFACSLRHVFVGFLGQYLVVVSNSLRTVPFQLHPWAFSGGLYHLPWCLAFAAWFGSWWHLDHHCQFVSGCTFCHWIPTGSSFLRFGRQVTGLLQYPNWQLLTHGKWFGLERRRLKISLKSREGFTLWGMALPTLILLSIEMAVGMPMLLLLEGWGTLVFNKFGFFLFRFFLCHEWFQKTRQGAEWCPRKSFPQKTTSEMWALLSRGTSMQLVYSFLGIFSVLVAALLDAWCHWSLQRDRTTPAEEIPGQCFGFWVILRWTWWSPICCYTFSTHRFTVSQSFINEFFLSKQDVVGSSPKTPRLAVKSQDSFRSKFFPQRRVVLEIPKHISGLESEGDSFAEVMSMLFRPIFLFFHIFGLHEFLLFSLAFTFGIPRFIKPI